MEEIKWERFGLSEVTQYLRQIVRQVACKLPDCTAPLIFYHVCASYLNSGNPRRKGVICDTLVLKELAEKKINSECRVPQVTVVPYFSIVLICALFSE